MKKLTLIFFVLIVSAQILFAKKKEDKDAKIDSLTTANTALTYQLDSVSKALVIYIDFYTVIKDRVVKHDFDPANISHMIDSVYALEKSSAASYAVLKDTLDFYKNENSQLKSTMHGISEPQSANNRLVYELKMLKDLLDSKIITQAEFDIKKTIIFERWK